MSELEPIQNIEAPEWSVDFSINKLESNTEKLIKWKEEKFLLTRTVSDYCNNEEYIKLKKDFILGLEKNLLG